MFKIVKKSKKSDARTGVLKTAHGSVKTPFFMPCATQGAVKTVSVQEMEKLGAQILLANTYHLMLRPGEKLIKSFENEMSNENDPAHREGRGRFQNKSGGLHNFMNWHKPILTDSGGFQIFSLAGNKSKSGKGLVELTKNGVKFRSYIDGKEYYLTPEKALKIQMDLGVDIAVCLDQCVALPAKKENLKNSVELTSYWAKKTKNYVKSHPMPRKASGGLPRPLLFCVIQGGLNKELRLKSLADLVKIGFSAKGGSASGWDGYNIGGLSVGETPEEMYAVLDYLCPQMPDDKPRYLMGVGYPEQIVEAVKKGVDMFDCVIPTREGRHGRLFCPHPQPLSHSCCRGRGELGRGFYKIININRAKFKKDFSPINPNSKLAELREYSLAYLRHLFKIKEPLGQRLASLNNLEFYLDLMEKIRYCIKTGKL